MRHEISKATNEDELPSPHELMPLTQSLITPTLALAFNITINHSSEQQSPEHTANTTTTEYNTTTDSAAARTLKRPRLVWTPQLHKRFVDAVAHLGIKNAVPKTIMQLMSVDGLTRENVASHLQKYRLYLKRMQCGGGGGSTSGSDAAMDRLFASSPVPPQFLRGNNSDHFMPPAFVPPSQMGGFRRFDDIPGFMRQQQQQQGLIGQRGVGNGNGNVGQQHQQQQQAVYVEDLEGSPRGKRVLTLFPTG